MLIPTPINCDPSVKTAIQKLASSKLGPTSKPKFAGLTLAGLSGVLKATAGVISGSATLDDVSDGTSYERVAANQLDTGIYINATTTTKGIASFSSTYFSVTNGAVSLIAGGGLDHSDLGNLDYASAAHTGFEPTVTKGNLTETTSSVLTITGGTGAVIGSGATIQVGLAAPSNGDTTHLSTADQIYDFLVAGYQPLDAGLTSLAGLTYVSDSFIKVTATDTYAIRTIAETKTDLSLNLVENTALSTWAGTANITTLGTIATGTWEATDVGITHGGTGQSTQQAAIDALTNVSAATNEHILTKDTATGNAIFKAAPSGDNYTVKVDSGAAADYIGAANSDGVLRAGTSLSYTDGGDFITLDAIQDIRTTATPTFAGLTVVNAITEFSTDGTLGGDSDSAVPTEKAVKTYVDNFIGCRCWHTENQTIGNATWTTLSLDSEVYDTDTMHDTVTNNSRITFKTAGKYLVQGLIGYGQDATGSRGCGIYKNNTSWEVAVRVANVGASYYTYAAAQTVSEFSVNDYIELKAWQNSGGDLVAMGGGVNVPIFLAIKVGE